MNNQILRLQLYVDASVNVLITLDDSLNWRRKKLQDILCLTTS